MVKKQDRESAMVVCIKRKRNPNNGNAPAIKEHNCCQFYPPSTCCREERELKQKMGLFNILGLHQWRQPQTGNMRQTPAITNKAMALKPRIKHSASPSLMYLFGGMPKPFNVRTRGTKSLCDTATRQQMYKTRNKNRPCR